MLTEVALPLAAFLLLRFAGEGASTVTETLPGSITSCSNVRMMGAKVSTSVPSSSASAGVAVSADLWREVAASLGVLPPAALAIGTGFIGMSMRRVLMFWTGARLARV